MPDATTHISDIGSLERMIDSRFRSNDPNLDLYRDAYLALVDAESKKVRPLIAASIVIDKAFTTPPMKFADFLGTFDLSRELLERATHIVNQTRAFMDRVIQGRGSAYNETIRNGSVATLEWLDQVGIGSKAFKKYLAELNRSSQPTESHIIFPFVANAINGIEGGHSVAEIEKGIAVWVADQNSKHWTDDEKRGVENMLNYFPVRIAEIGGSKNLDELYNSLSTLIGLFDFLKRSKGIRFLGHKIETSTPMSFNVARDPFDYPFPKNLTHIVDSSPITYHVTRALFRIADAESLNPLKKEDRTKAVGKLIQRERAKSEPDESKISFLESILSFVDVSLDEYEVEEIKDNLETLESHELAAGNLREALNWLDEVHLDCPWLQTAFSSYIEHPEDRDRKIIFPATHYFNERIRGKGELVEDFHTLNACWSVREGDQEWSKKELGNVSRVLYDLAMWINHIRNSGNLEIFRQASQHFLRLLFWLKEKKGVVTKGVNIEIKSGKPPDGPDMELPDKLVINTEPALLFYHCAVSLFRLAGMSNADVLDKNDRNRALHALRGSDEARGSDGAKILEWLTFMEHKMNNDLPENFLQVEDLNLVVRFAKTHFRKNDKNWKKKSDENEALIAKCTTSTYVAGQLQGHGNATSVCKNIKDLYISRPDPNTIRVAEGEGSRNLVWNGYFDIFTRSRTYRLQWRMDTKGDLYFMIPESQDGVIQEYGPNDFKNPTTKHFYYSMHGAVLIEIDKLLNRQPALPKGDKPSPPSDLPAPSKPKEPIPDGEVMLKKGKTEISIPTRRELTRREILRRRSKNEKQEARAALRICVQKYREILERIGESKTLDGIADQDLQGLQFYVIEEMKEGQIHIIGGTRELLAAVLENSEMKDKVFMCESRAHIRRCGYKDSRPKNEEPVTYRTQKIPIEDSNRRRLAVQKHFQIDEMDLDVPQEANLNVVLGTTPNQSELEWILIGPADKVHAYKNYGDPKNYTPGKKDDGCSFVRVLDMIDLESWKAKKKPNLPQGVESVDLVQKKIGSEGVWVLSFTVQVPQEPQFFEGEFISLAKAEEKYKKLPKKC